jgi:hypothetical protein
MSVCRGFAWSFFPCSLDPRTLGPCQLCRTAPAITATPSFRRLIVLLTATGAASRADVLPMDPEHRRGDSLGFVRFFYSRGRLCYKGTTRFVRTWKRRFNE